MTPLEAECPLELTEDDCRTLIRLLRHVITPDGKQVLPRLEPLSVILEKLEFAVGPEYNTNSDYLPPPDTKRWTARRKALVVAAVISGMINIEEACQRYGLSVEEYLSWHNAMQSHGLRGLRTTKLRNYRYSRPKRN